MSSSFLSIVLSDIGFPTESSSSKLYGLIVPTVTAFHSPCLAAMLWNCSSYTTEISELVGSLQTHCFACHLSLFFIPTEPTSQYLSSPDPHSFLVYFILPQYFMPFDDIIFPQLNDETVSSFSGSYTSV